VLIESAMAVGLDPERAKAIIEGQEFASEVRGARALLQQQGVSGVPFVVINNKYAIEGAQPPEAFEQAFRQIAQEK
jgi:predicted DsbA family dithiol-disulfide isomerase